LKTCFIVTEGFAQGCDMESQATVIDGRIRPGAIYQFAPADNLSGAVDESQQNIESTATEMNRLTFLE
jgi:hypothetical protein